MTGYSYIVSPIQNGCSLRIYWQGVGSLDTLTSVVRANIYFNNETAVTLSNTSKPIIVFRDADTDNVLYSETFNYQGDDNNFTAGTHTIGSINGFSVHHNNDITSLNYGQKSIIISCTITLESGEEVFIEEMVELDDLSEASMIEAVSDTHLGDECKITWTPKNYNYYYRLIFYFNGVEKYNTGLFRIDNLSNLSILESYTYTFNTLNMFSDHSFQYLMNQYLNYLDNSGEFKVELYSYTSQSQGSQICQPSSTTITLLPPYSDSSAPQIIRFEVTPVNDTPFENINEFISGYSTCKLDWVATTKKGSEIAYYTAYIGLAPPLRVSTSATSYVSPRKFTSAGNKLVYCSAQDTNKKNSLNVSHYITVHEYYSPIINSFSVYRDIDSGTQVHAQIDYSFADLNGSNSAEIKFYYREYASNTWIECLNPTVLNNVYTFNEVFSETTNYDFLAVVEDTIGNKDVSMNNVSTINVFMHLPYGGQGIGMGKICENNGIDVGWETYFHNSVVLQGINVPQTQYGGESVTTTTADQTVHIPVTFDVAFSGLPQVIVTVNTTAPKQVVASAANITESGFDLYLYRQAAGTNNVSWLAVYTP